MFSLIITIISIALVAALAVASVYYGGNQFQQGTAKAAASTLVSQAQQIAGAATLYANDNSGALAADVATLVTDGYLASQPHVDAKVGSVATYTLSGRLVSVAITNAEVAAKVQESITGAVNIPAAQADLSDLPDTQQFGVVDTNGATANGLVFFYKG